MEYIRYFSLIAINDASVFGVFIDVGRRKKVRKEKKTCGISINFIQLKFIYSYGHNQRKKKTFLLNKKEKLLFILIFVMKKPSDNTQYTRDKYLILTQYIENHSFCFGIFLIFFQLLKFSADRIQIW